MRSFVRENKVLIAGIALPIIMVIIFGLALLIPKHLVAPPQYDLLFVVNRDANRVKVNVKDRKLNIQFVCKDYNCRNTASYKEQAIYYYHVKENRLDRFPFDTPGVPANTNNYSSEIKIPELASLTLDPSPIAPDGYQFKFGDDNAHSILSELFYVPRNKATISKSGNTIIIPLPPSSEYYRPVQFVGWITARQGT